MADAPATRRRGDELESAIFDAVWEELNDVGYAALTISGVAARARTSKPVLYRRWPSRAQLVFAALVGRTSKEMPPSDTGALRSDVITLLSQSAKKTDNYDYDVFWGLLAETYRDPELASLVRTGIIEAGRSGPLAIIVERAVRRGEVSPDRVTPRRISLPLDLVRNEVLARGSIDRRAIEEIVDDIYLPLLFDPRNDDAETTR